jgi:tRNA1Val (adenine37-N6)-methyltransferase
MSRRFQFKQFALSDERSPMKIGTDAVLLGAWVNCSHAHQILDIGTGCGIISLMLAQRSNARILALEIDTASSEQCRDNFMDSPWADRLAVRNISLQEFCKDSDAGFEVITCNPPYFHNSLRSPDAGRSLARHNDSLTQHDLLLAANFLGAQDMRFNVVLPFYQSEGFTELAADYGLHCARKLSIRTFAGSPVVRVLLEFRRSKRSPESFTLILRNEDGQYSEEYRMLTKEYHLAF